MSQTAPGMRIYWSMQCCRKCHQQKVLWLMYNNATENRALDAHCLNCGYDYGRSLINMLCGSEVISGQPRAPLEIQKIAICPECVSTNCFGIVRGNEPVAFECYDCHHLVLPNYLGLIL
ncbi:MAG: hypothetical protein PHC53_00105 [Patescibacteria group bacterium]|nr:hypothetical protein [Patescibacteria group bacterium]